MTHERHESAAPELDLTAHPAFEAAYQAAQKGGIPIGAALARDGVVTFSPRLND